MFIIDLFPSSQKCERVITELIGNVFPVTGVSKFFFCGFFLLENTAFRIQFSVLKIPVLVFKTPTSAQCQFNTRKSFQIFCSRHVHLQSALQLRGKKTDLLLSICVSEHQDLSISEIFVQESTVIEPLCKMQIACTVCFYACGKFYTE